MVSTQKTKPWLETQNETTLTIRVDGPLKQAAERAAAARDETLSQVLRRALRDYVHQDAPRELSPAAAPRQIGRGGAISAKEAMRTLSDPQTVTDEMYRKAPRQK